MIDAPVRIVNEVIANFLACRPCDEEVLNFFIPPDAQARLRCLLELNRESELTAAEADELDEIVRADEFMSMLKTNTRIKHRDSV